ncbi:hypothetical protein ABMA80_15755, partial [Halobacteriovorax sp. FRX-3]
SMKQESAKEIVALNVFSPWADEKINFGTTTPPLGRYIHSAYYFDSAAILGLGIGNLTPPTSDGTTEGSGPAEEEISNPIGLDNIGTVNNLKLIAEGTVKWTVKDRPRCSGYHNGHVYFGDRDHNGKTRILVSQLVTSLDNIPKCFQDADPTAEEINDLIATDGFTMYPVGMGAPITMVEFNKRLLLLCTNGVWAIRGTSGGGATATDFTLDKVASVEFNSPQSVVDIGTAIVFWSERGIIAIGVNDFGDLTSNNLTENTIDEYYDSLDRDIIKNVKGTFINDENRVYWVVPNKQDSNGEYKADGELVLVLNLDTGGFYKHTVSGGPLLHAPFRRLVNTRAEVSVPITETDGTVITDTLGDPVTVTRTVTTTGVDGLAYFASYDDGVNGQFNFIAEHQPWGFADWANVPNMTRVNYSSFVDFAYEYPEVMIGNISLPYIHSYYLTGIRVQTEQYTTETAHLSFHRVQAHQTTALGTVTFHKVDTMVSTGMQVVSFHKDDLLRTEAVTLVNPDAETGDATGWTVTAGTLDVRNVAPLYQGSYYFWSDSNANFAAYQDIDPIGGGYITAGELANNVIEAKLSWAARGNTDRGTVYIECLDAIGTVLATTDTTRFSGHDTWTRYGDAVVLPTDTDTIRVWIVGTLEATNDVNYYVDDIQLNLEVHNV